jgi:hypothetical protein
MENRINLNWEFEYNILNNNVKKHRREYDNILSKIKATNPKEKEKIDLLVEEYNNCRDAEQYFWNQLVDFCKSKKQYRKHYKEMIKKYVNTV